MVSNRNDLISVTACKTKQLSHLLTITTWFSEFVKIFGHDVFVFISKFRSIKNKI